MLLWNVKSVTKHFMYQSSVTQLSKDSGCFEGRLTELKRGLNCQLEVKGSKGICANREEEMARSSADED